MLTRTHAHFPDDTDSSDTERANDPDVVGDELDDLLGDEPEDDDPDYDLYDDVDEM